MADIGAEDANLNEENVFTSAGDENGTAEQKPEALGKLAKLKKRFKRIIIGFIIILAGIGMFFLGGILGSGERVSTITPSPVKAKNNNKLVYLSAVPVEQEFTDQMFNITTKSLGLERVVEMYQWAKDGDKYVEKWSEEIIVIDDADAKSKGYTNPASLPFASEKWHSDTVSIGSFALSPSLAKQLNNTEALTLTNDKFLKLNQDGQKAFKLYKDSYFFGINPEKPNVGDLRISFKNYPASVVTVFAKQVGASLDVFLGKSGPIGILRPGSVGIEEISRGIDLGQNAILKWSLRGFSVFFVLVGTFVITGRRKKKLSQDEADQNEIISHNETYVEEEPEPTISSQTYQSEYSSPESVGDKSFEAFSYAAPVVSANIDSYDNFTEDGRVLQPNVETSDFTPFASEGDVPAPAERSFLAPEPLEFTFGESSAPQMQAEQPFTEFTSDAGSFGVEPVDFEPPASPDGAISFTEPQQTNSPFEFEAVDNYRANEYVENQSEEIPFEVDVITEDSLLDEGDIAGIAYNTTPAAPDSFSSGESFAGNLEFGESETLASPMEQSYNNQYHEALSSAASDEVMPEGVEIISEDEADTFSDSVSEDEQSGASGLEFIQEEVVAATQEKVYESLALPPPPDYDSLFASANISQTMRTITSEESYPLPPKPDFDKLFAEISVESTRAEQADEVAIQENTDKFSPDFEVAESVETYQMQEAENDVATISAEPASGAAQAVSFDLPPIPDDFDPNAEMSGIVSPYDNTESEHQDLGEEHFSGDEDHSPFGDAEDNPFAEHDENKN